MSHTQVQNHTIDFDTKVLEEMQERLRSGKLAAPQQVRALENVCDAASVEDLNSGRDALCSGKVACLLIAGGQGSRLGFSGPKGVFPFSEQGKSLFQVFAEKVKVASEWAQYPLAVAVMTSPENHVATIEHFKENSFWGLSSKQVHFFQQTTRPFLDEAGHPFLGLDGRWAEGPDGNGTALQGLYQAGIWDSWQNLGVRWVQCVLVDNPLAHPFDTRLAAFHSDEECDVVVKCCERQDPDENVGILAELDGHVGVLEYTEVCDADRYARTEQGQLLHNAANISLFSFSMDFIYEAASQFTEKIPWHLAHKSVSRLGPDGSPYRSQKPDTWKFEKFIFDLLAYSNSTAILRYPRQDCFAPLKNAKGSDSPESVRNAMRSFERRRFPELVKAQSILDVADYYPQLLQEGC